jgi:Zn-dependent protease with chaperone function
VDFYSRQAAARGQTRWLVFAFALALLAVALALVFVLFTFLGRATDFGFSALGYAAANPGAALFCILLVMGVLGLASLYKTMELRGGGGVVARSLGGVLLTGDTGDLKRKRLLNVVEEMAIASGVPMPEVYVLEQEPGINAFAAGHTPANAAVTVTQGALDRLTREELQGVIGHEFSHILNGDMRLNVQLMGWLFGLFVIGLIGRMIVQVSPRNRRDSNALVALGFAVIVLGYVGLLAGRILQAAVARQRERLADASGVQFTRNPQGLKGALMKIAASPDGSALVAADGEQAAHMFFAEGLGRVFATHPPILERIRELDPQFDPRELERVAAAPDQDPSPAEFAANESRPGLGAGPAAAGAAAAAGPWQRAQVAPGSELSGAGLSGAAAGMMGAAVAGSGGALGAGLRAPRSQLAGGGLGGMGQILPGARSGGVDQAARMVASQVGQPDTAHLEHAQAVRLALPPEARELTESPGGAQALVIALLIGKDPAVRERQFALLTGSTNAATLQAIQRVIPVAQSVDPMLRLPVVQRSFPALRRATATQRKALARVVSELIHADQRVDVFEFCLAKLLETLLSEEPGTKAPHGSLTLENDEREIALLFAVIAQIGAQDERAARTAYEVGISSVLPMRRPAYAAIPDWQAKLSAALPRLEQLHPFAKKAVIEGLVKTIANDEMLMDEEAELLRTVCALLQCPLPPMLPVIAGDPLPADEI